jgi:uncharacterized LabA/DUF88 family protein
MGFGTLGSIGRGAVASSTPIQYLFIDGGCLRETILQIGNDYAAGAKLEVDFAALTAGFHKVFYYDALPSRLGTESEFDFKVRHDAVAAIHDRLGALDRFHVYEGETRRSLSRAKQEQKKVDIMIAVDMLTHSFRRNMQQATLLTADLDFKPLLDALVMDGMFVTLWCPPNRTNADLVKSADKRRHLNVRTIHPTLLPISQGHFSIPQVWGQVTRSGHENPIKSWKTRDGDFDLYHSGNQFVLVALHEEISGNALHHQHHDLNFFKQYSRDVLSSTIPD